MKLLNWKRRGHLYGLFFGYKLVSIFGRQILIPRVYVSPYIDEDELYGY